MIARSVTRTVMMAEGEGRHIVIWITFGSAFDIFAINKLL